VLVALAFKFDPMFIVGTAALVGLILLARIVLGWAIESS
jgi:hypothetical protein